MPYLSIKETAERLECSPDTVRRLIARGELKANRLGRTSRLIRIDAKDVEKLLRPVTPLNA